jgi:hypothetical protein
MRSDGQERRGGGGVPAGRQTPAQSRRDFDQAALLDVAPGPVCSHTGATRKHWRERGVAAGQRMNRPCAQRQPLRQAIAHTTTE